MAGPVGQLAGKLTLVTGAGSGIGRAVCDLFSREGARVAAVDLNEAGIKETLASLKGDHNAFTADVSSLAAVQDMLQKVKDTYSEAPSVAVNCAGITQDRLFIKMDEDSFDKVININLKGSFLLAQAVARSMLEARIKNGSIVNISSITGKIGNIGQVNYSASKSGVIGLTKTAARELAPMGIRVNAIMPGFIVTPMTDKIPEKVMEQLIKMIPIGRTGRADEIADACLFLASDRSSYCTGTVLEVTGGVGM